MLTFGRAASEELRERVREQLAAAERVLACGPATARHRPADRPAGAACSSRVAPRRWRCGTGASGTRWPPSTRPRSRRPTSSARWCSPAGGRRRHRRAATAGRGPRRRSSARSSTTSTSGASRPSTTPPVFTPAAGAAHCPGRRAATRRRRLEPQGADRATPAGRRRRFAEAVSRRVRPAQAPARRPVLRRPAQPARGRARWTRRRRRGRGCGSGGGSSSSTSSRTPTRCSGRCCDRAFSGHATMVLIGDPKQAIYAFRGGDVVTYLDAARTATQAATLGTNHRVRRRPARGAAGVARGSGARRPGHRRPHGRRAPRGPAAGRCSPPRAVPAAAGRPRMSSASAGGQSIPMPQLREHVADDLAARRLPHCSRPVRRSTADPWSRATSRSCAARASDARRTPRRSVPLAYRRSSAVPARVFTSEASPALAHPARGDGAAAPAGPGAGRER